MYYKLNMIEYLKHNLNFRSLDFKTAANSNLKLLNQMLCGNFK